MAVSTKQPFEVSDFHGGITDEVYSGSPITAYQMDNFVIGSDTKLYSRPGSQLDDAANSPIPSGNQRVGLLVNYARNDKLFLQSQTNFYYRPNANLTGAWSTLTGPSGNPVLNAWASTNFVSTSEWNRHIIVVGDAFSAPMKIYKDGGGVYQVRNAGAPPLASAPVVTAGGAGAGTYIYAFLMTYTYTVGTKTFKDFGPTTLVTVTSAAAPNVNPIAISGIPAITNAGGQNYDVSNPTFQLNIYRTINNGTNFYFVGAFTNGSSSTYSDAASDALIQGNNNQLYINDGTLDFYPAPRAKFVHVVNNIGYYGYTLNPNDGSPSANAPNPYRVHQSTPGNPQFVPQTTWEEVEDEVTGVGSVKSVPMLFCKKVIYRLEGTYDNKGRGGINPISIHPTAGCVSHASIVEADNWVFWAGNDGFYASDGYMVMKISDHLNTRYQQMLSAMAGVTQRIQGKYSELERKVYWALQLNAASNENDTVFALDLRWGVTPKSSFTTGSGKSFKPTALEVFSGSLYRGDNNGFVYQHSSSFVTDPKVDTSVASNLWNTETIIWNYQSNHYNFGSSFFRKAVPRILFQAGDLGNTTVQINAINDQGRSTRALKVIRWRKYVTWGDPLFVWGNPDCVWAAEGLIEQWRRLPAGGLRLSYIQTQITNGFAIIANSTLYGDATLSRAAKTLTILSGTWPSDSVGYAIKLSSDNYTAQYTISAIDGPNQVLTLLDPANTLPADGTYHWELFGYKKGEQLALIGFCLHWDNVDQNQATFQAGDDGGN